MRKYVLFSLTMFIAVMVAPPAMAQEKKVTDAQVNEAIKKAVEFLYSEQNQDGHWDQDGRGGHAGNQYAGWTSIITYALLTAGEEPQTQPKLRSGLKFLQEAETYGTYAVGLRAHVWNQLPDRYKDFLAADTERLVSSLSSDGGYAYKLTDLKYGDLSTTQYGVLGIWEGAKRDISISDDVWRRIEDRMLRDQNADGGWGYKPSQSSRGSMTAAGLALLYITQDYLHTDAYRTPGAYSAHRVSQAIQRGLDWFDKHFDGIKNHGRGSDQEYYAVGVERVGVAAGVKYFNKQDWYQEIASALIQKQKKEGSIGKDTDTAFAVIFLARGRSPISINKLSIPQFDWNNRPRDIANFNSWLSNEVERSLLWQVVDVNTSGEDWLDAPIVYLASHRPLSLTPEQEQNIKRYIDLGGMFVTVDEGNGSFSTSVKGLLKKLYPQYEMKLAAQDDYIYNVVYNVRGNQVPVETLNNGIRHLALHIQRGDPSWALHSRSRDIHIFNLFANFFHYATEKGNIRPKLETHVELRRPQGGGGPLMPIGRGRYQGKALAETENYANWDPEPGAWQSVGNWMYNNIRRDPDVKPIDLARIGDPEVDASEWSEMKFLHIAGTDKVEWTEQEIAGLRRYAQSGGVVLLEAAGGNLEFADSISKLVAAAFPGQHPRPLSSQSDVLKGEFTGGTDNSRVLYRMFAQQRVGRLRTPRLQALTLDGQPRVIISNEDLSLGLLDQPVWGIYGYHSDSARQIMTNITLWAQSLPAIEPVNPNDKEETASDESVKMDSGT